MADRDEHAGQPDQHRQREPAAHPQLAHIELAPRLQPDDQEEQCHQPRVHEPLQIGGDAMAADQHRQARRPHLVVRGQAHVCPEQGRDRRYGQD